jgi:hypothetical protein
MQVADKRIKGTRLIQTDRYVDSVDVEMVIPEDDPSEPCYQPEFESVAAWLAAGNLKGPYAKKFQDLLSEMVANRSA